MRPLLLLHGAIGSSEQLQSLADRLSSSFKVYKLDFSGHGNAPETELPFSIEFFANDVLKFMEQERLEKVSIFGYSMGGYVGMYLAKHYPERIDKIITLATKYRWTLPIAEKEVQMLNPEKMEQKVPAFAETLKQRHAPHDWRSVLNKTAAMMISLGDNNTLRTEDYLGINTPVLLLLGDSDKMVSLDETVTVFKTLPKAQMGVLPATQHPIEQVDLSTLVFIIVKFLV